jgi:hypothetical protein
LVVVTLLSEDLPDCFVQQPLVAWSVPPGSCASLRPEPCGDARADPEPAARLRMEALLRYHARSEEAAAALRAG